MGRFLNADALISTGQGVLGNNMFAYCNNNPANGYDPTGELTRGQIHNAVLAAIIKLMIPQGRVLSMSDTTIYYNRINHWGGWGFCDLYDSSTGEVWELKRITCSEEKAKKQLNKYIGGRLKEYKNLSLRIGGALFTGKHKITVFDGSVKYHITYWQGENGILWYDYYTEGSKGRGVAAIMAIIFLTGSGGGGSAPVEHTNVKAIEDKIGWAA